ncbi:MAG: hypothetical protein U1A72_12120 [Sulfuritalea sp.]|nr:hypothetical protein [Sulfuritalea sp.]
MNAGFLLLIGIATIVWGIGIKERCMTKQAYMEDHVKKGFDLNLEKLESSYAAYESDVMQGGNLAIGAGVLIFLAAFV